MRHTPEQIKEAIKNISSLDTETLSHQFKCALSMQDTSSKNLYKPFLQAVEKELKSRIKLSVKSLDEIEEDTTNDSKN